MVFVTHIQSSFGTYIEGKLHLLIFHVNSVFHLVFVLQPSVTGINCVNSEDVSVCSTTVSNCMWVVEKFDIRRKKPNNCCQNYPFLTAKFVTFWRGRITSKRQTLSEGTTFDCIGGHTFLTKSNLTHLIQSITWQTLHNKPNITNLAQISINKPKWTSLTFCKAV